MNIKIQQQKYFRYRGISIFIGDVGIISGITFITLLFVVCMYSNVMSLPAKIVLMVIGCSVYGTGLVVAMEGDRRIGYFKCKKVMSKET